MTKNIKSYHIKKNINFEKFLLFSLITLVNSRIKSNSCQEKKPFLF